VRRLAALSLAVALVLTGCGDDESSISAGDRPSGASAAASSAASSSDNKDLTMKPTVTVPAGPAPSALKIDDLVVGAGAAAEAGKPISVQYVGVSYSTGKQFDASWDSGKAFDFTLGAGKVIQGWDEGIVGMKVGGRRQLTIPPDKAYGAQGFPPVIAPNETLVFVVDLLKVG